MHATGQNTEEFRKFRPAQSSLLYKAALGSSDHTVFQTTASIGTIFTEGVAANSNAHRAHVVIVRT